MAKIVHKWGDLGDVYAEQDQWARLRSEWWDALFKKRNVALNDWEALADKLEGYRGVKREAGEAAWRFCDRAARRMASYESMLDRGAPATVVKRADLKKAEQALADDLIGREAAYIAALTTRGRPTARHRDMRRSLIGQPGPR